MTAPEPDQLLEQAAAAAAANEHLQAIQLYTDLLAQTNPQSPDLEVMERRLTALRERGRLFNLLGEQEAALACYEQYNLEAGSSSHVVAARHAVDALVLTGNQGAYMGRTGRALNAHREALHLAESLNYTAGRARAFGGMGLVFTYLGRSEEALENLRKAQSLFEQLGDSAELARGWNRVGACHMRLGQLDKAIVAFQSSIQLVRAQVRADATMSETGIHALSNLGECYQSLFDMEQALIHHQEGLALAGRTELPYMEADLSRNLGIDLRYLGRVEEGLTYLYRSLFLSRETNQPDVEVQALYSLAVAEIERGNLEEGRAQAEHLQRLAEKANNKSSLADAFHALGLYHEGQGQPETAVQMWQQALFLAHETGRRMLLWQLHAALSRVASNPELAVVHNRIAAEIVQQIAHPIEDQELRDRFLGAAPVREILDRIRTS